MVTSAKKIDENDQHALLQGLKQDIEERVK